MALDRVNQPVNKNMWVYITDLFITIRGLKNEKNLTIKLNRYYYDIKASYGFLKFLNVLCTHNKLAFLPGKLCCLQMKQEAASKPEISWKADY